MSTFSNPFEVTINDLQVILGPQLPCSFSQDENNKSFISDHASDESYDEGNCFNIHDHQMKFAFKGDENEEKNENSDKNAEKEPKSDVLKMILKNVTLTINRIHIRYEDDFYADQNPFAFGLLCDVFFKTNEKIRKLHRMR